MLSRFSKLVMFCSETFWLKPFCPVRDLKAATWSQVHSMAKKKRKPGSVKERKAKRSKKEKKEHKKNKNEQKEDPRQ